MSDHEPGAAPGLGGGEAAGATPSPGGSLSAAPHQARLARGWWVGRWMRALGQIFDPTRLAAGRALVHEGRILCLEAQLGLVSARVRADSPEAPPHRVHMAFATFGDAQWERIIHLLGERAIYAAQLMNDEMPEDIEAVFRAAGVSLFPANLQELGAECTCSDWASTCKHRAAVCYQLGEWLDGDPFLLFTLRGRTREEVIAALRARRASQAAGASAEAHARSPQSATTDPQALPADPERFWRLGADVEALPSGPSAEGEDELPGILGELPLLQDDEMRLKLEAIYREVARRAHDAATGAGKPGDGHAQE